MFYLFSPATVTENPAVPALEGKLLPGNIFNGEAVANFSLVVNESLKNGDGE